MRLGNEVATHPRNGRHRVVILTGNGGGMQLKRIILSATAVVTLLVPALGTGAQAAAPMSTQGVKVVVGNHVGTEVLNVRSGPTLGSRIVGGVLKGDGLDGLCWVYGDEVTRWGVRNNIWVKTVYGNPPAYAWVWAGGLAGDERGGVPNVC